MPAHDQYLEINRLAWNARTPVHVDSDFYNVSSFLKGESSLKEIELNLLGDIAGLKILHLQCHFGQDTLSLARLGASVTGVDLSDEAIKQANSLAELCGIEARFICCDLYSLPQHLNESFDVVFTSYGTIGWLPDLNKWAAIINSYLKPGGKFVFAEFHPVVWMFDPAFEKIEYPYLKDAAIVETETGTYANTTADINRQMITWNHGLAETLQSLINAGLAINQFEEFDYSPYDCFEKTEEFEPGKFRIIHLGNKIPMVYALVATKKIGE